MQLSEHFTLDEFTQSQTAIRKGIDNTPDEATINNLKSLCVHVLEPLRTKLSVPIIISSGYRSKALNKAIGGASKSQHIQGKAADISVHGYSAEDLFQFIRRNIPEYDQCIQEYDSWVHISWNGFDSRNESLKAIKRDGQTVYLAA